MGTLGGGNGGERPFEGGNRPEPLSGLPPEWGMIVIPDDPSELAEEAEEVRRELGRATRRDRWRRRFRRGLRVPREPSVGLPLLIMAVAVIATLTSLFVIAWPKQQRQVLLADRTPTPVAEMTLVDANGTPVRLRDVLPAVVVLVEGCLCDALLGELAVAAHTDVAVLAVSRAAPSLAMAPPADRPPPGGSVNPVRPLADPADALRARLGLPPPGGSASIALISRTGQVIRLVPKSRSVDEFRLDLATLR